MTSDSIREDLIRRGIIKPAGPSEGNHTGRRGEIEITKVSNGFSSQDAMRYVVTLRSLEAPPQTLRRRLRWLSKAQSIYLNGRCIYNYRQKFVVFDLPDEQDTLAALRQELERLNTIWGSVALEIKYRASEDSSDRFKASLGKLHKCLKDDGVNCRDLKKHIQEFLKLYTVELERLVNVRQTMASVRYTSGDRVGGYSMLHIRTPAFRRGR